MTIDVAQFALDSVAKALGRWLGETQGQAVGQLINAIRVASVQMDVARRLLTAAEDPKLRPDERAKLILSARELVAVSREDVRTAARGTLTAIPEEVNQAFDHFAESAAKAAGAVAEQAKQTAFGYMVFALVALWLWMQHRGSRS